MSHASQNEATIANGLFWAWQAATAQAQKMLTFVIGGLIMRILGIVIALSLLSGACAKARAENAPSPEALQAATELMSIMSPDIVHQTATQATNAVWPQLAQTLRAQNVDDATLAELRNEFERVQMDIYPDLLKDAQPIYARHFTVDEMHQLIAFYKSPVGAKALRELPQVMGSS
jgi:uncharacterized protein